MREANRQVDIDGATAKMAGEFLFQNLGQEQVAGAQDD